MRAHMCINQTLQNNVVHGATKTKGRRPFGVGDA